MSFLKYRLADSYAPPLPGIPGNVPVEVSACDENETVSSPWLKATADEYRSLVERTKPDLQAAQQQRRNDELRQKLAQRIRSRSWEVETGGLVVAGVAVDTSRESQSLLAGAVIWLGLNPVATVDWQGIDGTFVSLNRQQVDAMASDVGAFIQSCFSRRKALAAILDGAKDEDLPGVERIIEKFWE